MQEGGNLSAIWNSQPNQGKHTEFRSQQFALFRIDALVLLQKVIKVVHKLRIEFQEDAVERMEEFFQLAGDKGGGVDGGSVK